ncbi:MAG TPA: RHS repeat-associated core domain-containing protein, partial [Candidatus Acidoferrum sp.]|nr:RHS repeat-associated core domain-containing protein [Candidatus Acidoferrum sp.]
RGVAGGPGALTTAGPTGASFGLWWSGLTDAFSRVNTETNNAIGFLAYGKVNGQSTLSAYLDSQPIDILSVGTNAMQWRTFLELPQGPHQLQVNARHPSGFFTASATNSFTNNITYQVAFDQYDAAGNITNRVYRNASGATNRTQTLSWDAKGRLRLVMERNTNNYGFNWSAVYDGLNRRISTTITLVSNGVPSVIPPQMFSSYYDPQTECLELGVLLTAAPQQEFLESEASPSIQTTWKLYGPDLNGQYGGLNGVGGFDAVSPYQNNFDPVISDARGNVLAEETNGVPYWTLARPTGYGAVPGYRPVAFGNGVDLAHSSVWRGHEVDVTGFYYLYNRYYDPVAGQWLSFDPTPNDIDPNGQSYCGGDSINYFDPDGRLGKGAVFSAKDVAVGTGTFLWNILSAASLADDPNAAVDAEESLQGLENTASGLKYLGGQAWQGNWGFIGKSLTGGEGRSGAFRVSYAGTSIASFFVGAGEVRAAAMPGQIASRVAAVNTTRLAAAETSSGIWQSLAGGVRIKQVGNYWVKEVDPNASSLAQWWGKGSLNAQAAGLQKLGDMAPSFLYQNDKLITRDAGAYTPGNFWGTWWQGTMRLGTPMNDIRPRNIGANGFIFDPSLHPVAESIYWVGAGTVAGTAGYGLYYSVYGGDQ